MGATLWSGGALSSTARATLVSHTRELCVRPTGIGRTKDPERRQKPVHLPHVSTEQKTRGLTCRHMTICKVEIKAKTFSCFHLYVSKYNAIIFETLALAHTKKKIKKNSQKCSPAGQHRVVGGAESGGGGRSDTLSPHLASGPRARFALVTKQRSCFTSVSCFYSPWQNC